MGYTAQVQQPTNKPQDNQVFPMGKGGSVTNSATSGQPRIGQPNLYPNTVGIGDNMQQQPQQAQAKGKGV